MNLQKFCNLNDLKDYGSNLIVQEINQQPDLLVCTASGNSTTAIYSAVGKRRKEFDSAKLRIIKLDEWGGIPAENSGTCETYLKEHVVNPWGILPENYLSFQSNPVDPKAEVNRIQTYLDQHGPIDLCVLGLGLNGHIAFNEPHTFLQPDCHISVLSEASQKHPMFVEAVEKPTYGLTLGMSNILQSKRIMLVIMGKNKQEVIAQFLKKEISTSLPASFLWLHPKVDCLIMEE